MKRIWIAAALLFCSLAAHADDFDPGMKKLSIFITDPSFTESDSQGSDVSGGTGLAFSYAFTRQWSAQLSVAAQEHRAAVTTFTPISFGQDNGVVYAPVTVYAKVRTYPIELLGRYRFPNESRWTPFLGAGFRYVQAPDVPSAIPVVTPGVGGVPVTVFNYGSPFHNRLSGELAGGVALRITNAVSLDIEGRRLLRSEGLGYDPVNRGVVGVSWNF